MKIYIAPLRVRYSEALPTQAKQKIPGGIENRHRLGDALDLREARSRLFTNHIKRTALHCHRAGEWDHQIAVGRGPQFTTACTIRERAAQLAQIGAPSQTGTATPLQGRDPVRDALWEWKPVQYYLHIL